MLGHFAPPPAQAPSIGDDWTFFSGTLTFDGGWIANAAMYEVSGLSIEEGGGCIGQTITTSDPRTSGQRTEIDNDWSDVANDRNNGIWTSLVTVENADGAWACSATGVWVDDIRRELARRARGMLAHHGRDLVDELLAERRHEVEGE